VVATADVDEESQGVRMLHYLLERGTPQRYTKSIACIRADMSLQRTHAALHGSLFKADGTRVVHLQVYPFDTL
jgi:hypothetical protein